LKKIILFYPFRSIPTTIYTYVSHVLISDFFSFVFFFQIYHMSSQYRVMWQ